MLLNHVWRSTSIPWAFWRARRSRFLGLAGTAYRSPVLPLRVQNSLDAVLGPGTRRRAVPVQKIVAPVKLLMAQAPTPLEVNKRCNLLSLDNGGVTYSVVNFFLTCKSSAHGSADEEQVLQGIEQRFRFVSLVLDAEIPWQPIFVARGDVEGQPARHCASARGTQPQ